MLYCRLSRRYWEYCMPGGIFITLNWNSHKYEFQHVKQQENNCTVLRDVNVPEKAHIPQKKRKQKALSIFPDLMRAGRLNTEATQNKASFSPLLARGNLSFQPHHCSSAGSQSQPSNDKYFPGRKTVSFAAQAGQRPAFGGVAALRRNLSSTQSICSLSELLKDLLFFGIILCYLLYVVFVGHLYFF